MTEWIVSSNPKVFRVDDAFRTEKTVDWFQTKSIKNLQVEDIVYIYVSSPIQELHWKCIVRDIMKPIGADDSAYYVGEAPSANIGPCAELEAIYEYTCPELVSYSVLKQHGLKSKMMGPCKVNSELSEYLSTVNDIETNTDSRQKYLETIPVDELLELAKKHSGKAKKTSVVSTTAYVRSHYVAEYAKQRANGYCQLCGKQAPFKDKSGKPYLESHHVVWLSRGGDDSIDNTVGLCPNCHKKMHVLDLPEDITKLQKSIQKNH